MPFHARFLIEFMLTFRAMQGRSLMRKGAQMRTEYFAHKLGKCGFCATNFGDYSHKF